MNFSQFIYGFWDEKFNIFLVDLKVKSENVISTYKTFVGQWQRNFEIISTTNLCLVTVVLIIRLMSFLVLQFYLFSLPKICGGYFIILCFGLVV